ncbi:MAG: hypothetical protein GY938_31995, partial [Ketobacter sp.]|nr:hypothetical protein [Ketobacter sp.]
ANYDFEYDGPFIGAVYQWDANMAFFKGTLTANIAAAFLDGEVSVDKQVASITINKFNGDSVPPVTAEPPGGFSNVFISDGDTLGLTFGMSWRGVTPVDGLNYSVGVSGYKYEFDADKKRNADIDEFAVLLKAGISYAF